MKPRHYVGGVAVVTALVATGWVTWRRAVPSASSPPDADGYTWVNLDIRGELDGPDALLETVWLDHDGAPRRASSLPELRRRGLLERFLAGGS